jgi:hypothetical protein
MALSQVVYDSTAKTFRPWDPLSDPPLAGQSFIHVQADPAAIWVVPHNLGTRALDIRTFDAAGAEIHGSPDWAAATTAVVLISFTVPVSGTAYIRPL